MERELEKLEINLGGVSTMTRLPDAVFVADPKREAIATKEVNKLGLPLIGLVDTNCDPDEVDYLIPGNDDAIRSCSLIVKTLARAVEEGRRRSRCPSSCAAEAAREAAQAQAAPSVGEGRRRRRRRSRDSRRVAARPQPATAAVGGQRPAGGGGRPGGSRPYSSDAGRVRRRATTPRGGRPRRCRRPGARGPRLLRRRAGGCSGRGRRGRRTPAEAAAARPSEAPRREARPRPAPRPSRPDSGAAGPGPRGGPGMMNEHQSSRWRQIWLLMLDW